MRWAQIVITCLLVPTSALAGGRKASSISHAGEAPQVLTSDPAPGTLGLGEIAYVDDQTCPVGQIKKVTGGNKSKGVARSTECVSR